MSRKEIIYLVANVPLIYILFSSFGWITYGLVGGNPAHLIPFGILIVIFFVLTVIVSIGIINLLKINSSSIITIAVIEIVAMYLLFWFFLS
jgi:hypothetical protein